MAASQPYKRINADGAGQASAPSAFMHSLPAVVSQSFISAELSLHHQLINPRRVPH